ncbi:hypothetical protein H9L39_06557 [Fusarium oxysporum f. sp. albedinis]|nr:hypothetical protein H9L39_06557 [Fusarium oxysporum f. sp. albedinis]
MDGGRRANLNLPFALPYLWSFQLPPSSTYLTFLLIDHFFASTLTHDFPSIIASLERYNLREANIPTLYTDVLEAQHSTNQVKSKYHRATLA